MPLILANPVRAYGWGSPTVIPDLLGVPATGEPQAELWMGAHPSAPSTVDVGGRRLTLTELVGKDPRGMLGRGCVERFGPRLPYLLKILAVARPLSIQAHPTAEQAASGFTAEEGAGIPVDAPHRSYRDRSHKPEMVVALTEFEALLGFRDPARTAELIDAMGVPDLRTIASRLRDAGDAALGSTVRHWLELPDSAAAELVDAVTVAADRPDADPAADQVGHVDRLEGLVRRLARWYPGDRGILLALLLRHVRLRPGEAAFTPAGMPHAYLSGVAIEAQASSDNTLRAGLTSKHVDAPELGRILRYEAAVDPTVQPDPGAAGELRYIPGISEFRLSRFELSGPTVPVTATGPRIVLVTDGTADIGAAGDVVTLHKGTAAFVPASDGPATLAGSGTAFVVAPDLTVSDRG